MIAFSQTGSGISFDEASDLAFSDAVTAPSSFSQCNYSPSGTYDPQVRYVCLTPQGALAAGYYNASNFSLSYHTKID